VTLIHRSAYLLRHADAELAQALTDELSQRVVVRLNQSVVEVDGNGRGGIGVYTTDLNDIEYSYDAEVLLVATGRIPNGDRLDLGATGVEVDSDGYVVVDAHQRTTAEGIFALGDVSNPSMLKHAANADARVVAHNLLHPDDLVSANHRAIPYAVFTEPQLAGIGATEQELRAAHTPYLAGVERYADVAYGWALEDPGVHVAKVLVDPETLRLLGCHILGPQASTLIQPGHPGDGDRARRTHDGARPVLDPPGPHGGARERPAPGGARPMRVTIAGSAGDVRAVEALAVGLRDVRHEAVVVESAEAVGIEDHRRGG